MVVTGRRRLADLAVGLRVRRDHLAMSESLTASEAEHPSTLLQRFTEHHLDQFDNWRFDTS